MTRGTSAAVLAVLLLLAGPGSRGQEPEAELPIEEITFDVPSFVPPAQQSPAAHLLKHTPDNRLVRLQVINLDLLQLFVQRSPEELRQSVQSGDADGTIANLLATVKTLVREVTVGCLFDLAVFLEALLNLATRQRQLNQCYALQADDDAAVCSCIAKVDADNDDDNALWPLRVLDAMGKPGSGVLDGNILWIGQYPVCKSVSHYVPQKQAYWQGKYCRTTLYMKNDLLKAVNNDPDALNISSHDQCFRVLPLLSYGLCVPDSCTTADVQKLINITCINPVNEAIEAHGYQLCDASTYCDERETQNFADDGWSIAMLTFLVLIFVLVVFATGYDYFVYNPPYQLLKDEGEPKEDEFFYAKQALFVKLILAFSLVSNTPRIFNTRKLPGQIHCLHGLRVLSMFWIIFSHTYYYALTSITLDNLLAVLSNFPRRFWNQIVMNGSLAVDTFFFLSGLLVTYLWFKVMKKRQGKDLKSFSFWANYYIHRYIRLTPVYMIILGVHVTLLQWVSNGPFWQPVERERCAKTWWANLVYINNFVGLTDDRTCMGWTWYLANDMQFFTLLPILLVLFWLSEVAGVLLSAALLLMSSILHLVLILPNSRHADRWPPAPVLTTDATKATFILDYWPEVYVKPYVRCGPYVVGVCIGYILFKYNLKVKMNKWLVAVGWIVCTVVGLCVVFGLFWYCESGNINDVAYIFYALFGRMAWAFVLAWIVFACATGYGGPVDAFLSWKAWMPLSRLTYCAYLIHPVLMITYYRCQQSTAHYGVHIQMIGLFFGFMMLSYGVAYITSAAFEVPVSHIETIGKSYSTGRQSTAKPVARENSLAAVDDALKQQQQQPATEQAAAAPSA